MPELTNKNAGGILLNQLIDFASENGAEFLPQPLVLNSMKKAFADSDLVNTCFCLFANNLNVSKTAAVLYMHRNTLIYRISKLKRLTGLDVTDLADAVTFIVTYRAYLNMKKAEEANLKNV